LGTYSRKELNGHPVVIQLEVFVALYVHLSSWFKMDHMDWPTSSHFKSLKVGGGEKLWWSWDNSI